MLCKLHGRRKSSEKRAGNGEDQQGGSPWKYHSQNAKPGKLAVNETRPCGCRQPSPGLRQVAFLWPPIVFTRSMSSLTPAAVMVAYHCPRTGRRITHPRMRPKSLAISAVRLAHTGSPRSALVCAGFKVSRHKPCSPFVRSTLVEVA